MPADRRGFFETPSVVGDFLCRWAIRSHSDRILEPCAGTGSLVRSAQSRLSSLGLKSGHSIIAVEKDKKLAKSLQLIPEVQTVHTDFLRLSPQSIGKVKAVIANPPFIRVRHLFRKRQDQLSNQFPKVSRRASIWAYFLAHARDFLDNDGRIAFVLPWELFTTDYGSRVFVWTTENFSSVQVLLLKWNVFESAQVRTLLLLCEGLGKTKNFRVRHVSTAESLSIIGQRDTKTLAPAHTVSLPTVLRFAFNGESKRIFGICNKLGFVPLNKVARVKIGFVTGCDSYFLLTKDEVLKWRLPACCLTPILASPKQLRGLIITRRDWEALRDTDESCYLMSPCTLHGFYPTDSLLSFLRRGKSLGVNKRFKCLSRPCWFVVPLPTAPDAFLSYMSYRLPRMVVNGPGLSAPNRLHYLYLSSSRSRSRLDRFAFAFANPITLATAELAGRTYGGGVLKLEPSDCLHVLVPDIDDHRLDNIETVTVRRVDKMLREGDEEEALECVSKTLAGVYGLNGDDLLFSKACYRRLRSRRGA